MTLSDKYIQQYRLCIDSRLQIEMGGHYQTRVNFSGKDYYVSPDGSDVVRYKFAIKGCIKKARMKNKKTGKVKTLYFHKDKLPVFGTITRRKNLKGFLYKYLLFLRCDGIENPEVMKLYVLHCLSHKFEFWRRQKTAVSGTGGRTDVKYGEWELYNPEYEDVEKMIDALIEAALKKQIDNETRGQFMVRTKCVVNPEVRDKFGGRRDKYSYERRRDSKAGQRKAMDNRIWGLYDPSLKDRENAERIGISIRRFQEWKADYIEPPRKRIERLYDPGKTVEENAVICNVSESTISRYKRSLPETVGMVQAEDPDDAWIDDFLCDEPAVPRKIR